MFFKKNTYTLLVFSNPLYANIRHDPRVEYNLQKSEHSEHQWSWRFWGVLTGCSILRRLLGLNKHLAWLKIDFNAAKIITVQDYNKKD